MIVTNKLFAHAGEAHSNTVEAFSHSASESQLFLPLVLVIAVLIPSLHYIATKKLSILLILVELFVIGVLGYQLSAWLSVVSLSVGFALALVLILHGLSGKE